MSANPSFKVDFYSADGGAERSTSASPSRERGKRSSFNLNASMQKAAPRRKSRSNDRILREVGLDIHKVELVARRKLTDALKIVNRNFKVCTTHRCYF